MIYKVKRKNSETIHKIESVTQAIILKGFSPYIDDNGNWILYDDKEQKFINTGIRAVGKDGKNGYIPVKGKDYFTESEIKEIENSAKNKTTKIVENLKNKVITVTTMKKPIYSDELINYFGKGTNEDGSLFNEVGYKIGYRFSSSGTFEGIKATGADECITFGFIPVSNGDTVRFNKILLTPCGSSTATHYDSRGGIHNLKGMLDTHYQGASEYVQTATECYIYIYDSNYQRITGGQLKVMSWAEGEETISGTGFNVHFDTKDLYAGIVDYITINNANAAYIAFSGMYYGGISTVLNEASITIDGKTEKVQTGEENVEVIELNQELKIPQILAVEKTMEEKNVEQDNEINELQSKTKNVIPAYTVADNGKVLGIKNGLMQWVYPNELLVDDNIGNISNNNEINIIANLNVGKYTLKYEDNDGNVLDEWQPIGVVEVK